MVKIEKEVTITITGDRDAGYLSDICELARRYIDRHGRPGHNYQVDEYTGDQISSIRMLMQKILEAVE